jgi:hypothetical protein
MNRNLLLSFDFVDQKSTRLALLPTQLIFLHSPDVGECFLSGRN